MSDGFWMGLFSFLGTLVVAYMQWRMGLKIEQVRHATNSLTDRLVATTGREAHAAGVKEEKERKDSP